MRQYGEKNKRIALAFVLWIFSAAMILAVCVTPNPSFAQSSFDAGGANGGSIRPGWSSDTCDGTIEGALRYNSSTSTGIEFCDGSNWTNAGGCTAPSDCPNAGDVCTDGSLFAGFILYNGSSCEPLFVTDNNQSLSAMWKTAGGTDDISVDDPVDGKVNAANRGGVITDFPAFDLCESNTYHGKSDWYLPARNEMHLLWLNMAAINANAAGAFSTSDYWTSTERSNANAWSFDVDPGDQQNFPKTTLYDVRCVRRD